MALGFVGKYRRISAQGILRPARYEEYKDENSSSFLSCSFLVWGAEADSAVRASACRSGGFTVIVSAVSWRVGKRIPASTWRSTPAFTSATDLTNPFAARCRPGAR